MKSRFSIAICPPDDIVQELGLLKIELETKAGKFASRNSHAHITFNVFDADEDELLVWQKLLDRFCNKLGPFEIVLDHAGANSRNAFFISPDERTLEILLSAMKLFFSELPYPDDEPIREPHMSIARKLKPDQLKMAFSLFGRRHFSLKFICDNLAIRKYNPQVGQYEIFERFKFRVFDPALGG